MDLLVCNLYFPQLSYSLHQWRQVGHSFKSREMIFLFENSKMSIAWVWHYYWTNEKRRKKNVGIWHYKKIWFFHFCFRHCIVESAILYFCYNLHNHLQAKNIIPTWRHVLIMFVMLLLSQGHFCWVWLWVYTRLVRSAIFLLWIICIGKRRICWTWMVYLYIMLQSERILTSLIVINEF